MSWQSYFDRIYVISLPDSERRVRVREDFDQYGIHLYFWDGIKEQDGKLGIFRTYREIFSNALWEGYDKIMIFEDDVLFVPWPADFRQSMDRIVQEAKMIDWMQIKLGSVLLRPVSEMVTPHLFRIESSYGLHAAAYSKEFMKIVMDYHYDGTPIDVMHMKQIEPLGKCLHSLPLLCSQYSGLSSIEGKHTNWDYHIHGSFETHTKKINLLNSSNGLP